MLNKVKELSVTVRNKTGVALAGVSFAATTALLSVPAWASEPTDGSALSFITEAMTPALSDVKVVALAIVAACLGVGVAIVVSSKGSDFLIKKIQGLLNRAN